MPLTEWNEEVQRRIVERYPELEGKSEGILFCAAVLEDEPDLRLNEMREKGRLFAPDLSFSPVSLTSAQVAMGRREKKSRKPRRNKPVSAAPVAAVEPEMPAIAERPGSGRLAKIERKLGNALKVLEQFDEARRSYLEWRGRISQLNPSVLALLAELDESAREILNAEGLLVADDDDDGPEGGDPREGGREMWQQANSLF